MSFSGKSKSFISIDNTEYGTEAAPIHVLFEINIHFYNGEVSGFYFDDDSMHGDLPVTKVTDATSSRGHKPVRLNDPL